MDSSAKRAITSRQKTPPSKQGFHIISWTLRPRGFWREVERIMNMIDGVLLVVDSVDGPQAQSVSCSARRWRPARADRGHNKIDREQRDAAQVLDLCSICSCRCTPPMSNWISR